MIQGIGQSLSSATTQNKMDHFMHVAEEWVVAINNTVKKQPN